MQTPTRPSRSGRLTIPAGFLDAVPPDALDRALRSHRRASGADGRPFETLHSHDGVLFRLRTSAGRTRTAARLTTGRAKSISELKSL